MSQHQQRSLDRRILGIVGVLLFMALAFPVLLGVYYQSAANEAVLQITCTSARSNISQLEALAALEHRLGIPQDFTIPPLPEECK